MRKQTCDGLQAGRIEPDTTNTESKRNVRTLRPIPCGCSRQSSPLVDVACTLKGVFTKRPCMPARESWSCNGSHLCKPDMSKHAGDDTNLVSQSDCTLKYRNSRPPIPSGRVSFAPSASAADDLQPARTNSEGAYQEFLASFARLFNRGHAMESLHHGSS